MDIIVENTQKKRLSIPNQLAASPNLQGSQIMKLKVVRSHSNMLSFDKRGHFDSELDDFNTGPGSPIHSFEERQKEMEKGYAKNRGVFKALTNFNQQPNPKKYIDLDNDSDDDNSFFSDSYEVNQKQNEDPKSPYKLEVQDSNTIPDGESDGEIKRLPGDDSDESHDSIGLEIQKISSK